MGKATDQRLRHDAFISYSHTPRSTRIARDLQSGLHRFARPWYRARAARIFLDTTDLAATPQLWGDIRTAMAESACFILIASPEAAQSIWVRREIEWWLANKSIGRLIVVVADGVLRWDTQANRIDPASTAVPEELIDAFPEEPLWIDLTARGPEDEGLSRTVRQHDVASIAARLRGVSLDAVFGEHLNQQRRTRRTVALVMVILVALAGGAVAASVVALRERNEAVAAADRAASHNLVLQSTALRAAQVDRALVWHTADPTAPIRRRSVDAGVGPVTSVALGSGDTVAAFSVAPPPSAIAGTTSLRLHRVDDLAAGVVLTERQSLAGDQVVSFSPDGHTLLSANLDIDVSALWSAADVAHPVHVGTIDTPFLDIRDAMWSADGSRLMLNGNRSGPADSGGGLTLWDVSDLSAPVEVPLAGFADRSHNAAAMSPDATLLAIASGGIAEELSVWDIADPANPKVVNERAGSHPAVIRSVAFSPRGGVIATGSNDQTVALWSLPAGERLAVLDGHELAVSKVVFTPDATMITVLDDSGAVTFWDVSAPTHPVRLHTIPTQEHNPAVSFAVSGDGRRVVIGRAGGDVEVWDIGRIRDIVNDPVRVACTLTGRGLTESEWRLYVPERPFRPTC